MADRIVVKKSSDVREPGPWWRKFGARVLLRCGECQEKTPLDHEVRAGGEVHPSVVCPMEGCSWHVWLTLEGWPG